MSRNRLKHRNTLHWAMVMKWILVVGLLSALGLSYIVSKNQILRIAEEIKREENELAGINKRNQELMATIQHLRSPQELQRRVEGMRLVSIIELKKVTMDHGTMHAPSLHSSSRIARTESSN